MKIFRDDMICNNYNLIFFCCRQVRETSKNALIYVDAVHYAPHMPIDVQDLDCDFCVCSTFKFFWSPLWNALWQELFDEYFETIQTKSEC